MWVRIVLLSCAVVLVACRSRGPVGPGLIPSQVADWSTFGRASLPAEAIDLTWSPDGTTLWVVLQDGRVFVLSADRTIDRMIEPAPEPYRSIAFLQGARELLVMPADGGAVVAPLDDLAAVRPTVGVFAMPAVCRVSGRIVSVRGSELTIARPDAREPNANPLELPLGGPWSFDLKSLEDPALVGWELADPAWAGDGSGVVFVARASDTASIVEVNSSGENPRRVVSGLASASDPVVHPELEEIWFERDGVLMRAPRGGGAAQVVRPGRLPCFSPDGGWLAFVVDRTVLVSSSG